MVALRASNRGDTSSSVAFTRRGLLPVAPTGRAVRTCTEGSCMMSVQWPARLVVLATVAVLTMSGAAQAAPVVPTFDTFGTLMEATFGGSGIPNDAVAIGRSAD